MNRTTLRMLCVAGFALYAASCSQGQPAATTGGSTPGGGATSTGGATGSGGSTQTVSGGTTVGSGGATQTGGSPVTGGTTSSSGGTASSGGTTTSSGGTTRTGGEFAAGGMTTSAGGTTTNAGGTTRSGGTTTSSGGTTTSAGGTTTNAGGTTTSAGGTTRSGGTTTSSGGTTTSAGGTTRSGGTTSAGGTMTSTGGAGGGTTVDPSTIVPSLVGYMWVGTCSNGSASGLDCPLNDASGQCPNSTATDFNQRGLFRTVTHNVGGTAGTQYTITFEVRGIVGTKCYTGGTTTLGTTTQPTLSADPETSNNGWYIGGTPTDSKWNTYEIHTYGPGSTTQDQVYYLNAFTQTVTGWCEKHETFPMKYTASFTVKGGGTFTMVLHDSNCLGQMNCGGPDNQKTCANPRTMDLTGMSVQPTTQTSFASMQQPYKQTNGFWPQWLLFDVKSVTSP